MSLSRRQQVILDQMDRALGAADPQLRTSYAAFARRAKGAPFPAAEVIASRPIRYVVLGLIVFIAFGFLALGIFGTHSNCVEAGWHGVCVAASTTGRG